jgi:hypothetical protein
VHSLDSLASCHDRIHANASKTTEEKEQEGIIEKIRMGQEATHRGRGKSPEIMSKTTEEEEQEGVDGTTQTEKKEQEVVDRTTQTEEEEQEVGDGTTPIMVIIALRLCSSSIQPIGIHRKEAIQRHSID